MSEEEWKHIGDTSCFQRQRYYWNTIPKEVRLDIEIIDFYTKYEIRKVGDGAYQVQVVCFMKDYPEFEIKKDDIAIVYFPYITLFNAIAATSGRAKKEINRDHNDCNIAISFTKYSKKHMIIHTIKRKDSDLFLSEEAERILKDEYPERVKDE